MKNVLPRDSQEVGKNIDVLFKNLFCADSVIEHGVFLQNVCSSE